MRAFVQKHWAVAILVGALVLGMLGQATGQVDIYARLWDSVAQAWKVTLATTTACEDVANQVCRVESRFSNLPAATTTSIFSSDILIKTGPGFLSHITCYSDATATAGTIALRDNTAAGAGDTLWSFAVLAVEYNKPFTVPFNVPFSVGLYADFTTTADMFCNVSYR